MIDGGRFEFCMDLLFVEGVAWKSRSVHDEEKIKLQGKIKVARQD